MDSSIETKCQTEQLGPRNRVLLLLAKMSTQSRTGPSTRIRSISLLIPRILARADADFALVATLALRSWSVLAGGLTTFLLPLALSRQEQGYYFTFASLLAAQILFELGLNQVLVQFTAHAAAGLEVGQRGQINGDLKSKLELYSIIAFAKSWSLVTGIAVCLCLLAGGGWLFLGRQDLLAREWAPIWGVLCVSTGVNVVAAMRMSIHEGMGRVGEVAMVRLWQSMLGHVVLWMLALTGLGLWSSVAVPITGALASTIWLRSQRTNRLRDEYLQHLTSSGSMYRLNWRRDVYPLQWRLALSWFSSYFIFHFITPVVFANQGAAAAGRVGLALAVLSALTAVGMSWVNAKVPALARCAALGKQSEMNSMFGVAIRGALAATVTGIVVTGTALEVLGSAWPELRARMPSNTVLFLLSAAAVGNVCTFSLAAYLRAYKVDPLARVFAASGAAACAGIYLGSTVNVEAAAAAYAFVTVGISLPWTVLIFRKFRPHTSAARVGLATDTT